MHKPTASNNALPSTSSAARKKFNSSNQDIEEFLEIENRLNQQSHDPHERPHYGHKRTSKASLSKVLSKPPNPGSGVKVISTSGLKDSVELNPKKLKGGFSSSPKHYQPKEDKVITKKVSEPLIQQRLATSPNTQTMSKLNCHHTDNPAPEHKHKPKEMKKLNLDVNGGLTYLGSSQSSPQQNRQPKDLQMFERDQGDQKSSLLTSSKTDRYHQLDQGMIAKQCTDIKSKVNQILAKYKITLNDDSGIKEMPEGNQSSLRILSQQVENSPRNEDSRDSSRILKDLNDSLNNDSPLALDQHLAIYKREIRRHINQEVLKVIYDHLDKQRI